MTTSSRDYCKKVKETEQDLFYEYLILLLSKVQLLHSDTGQKSVYLAMYLHWDEVMARQNKVIHFLKNTWQLYTMFTLQAKTNFTLWKALNSPNPLESSKIMKKISDWQIDQPN